MIESVSKVQVRYAETDMMGIVYHANYLAWLEIGRTQLLREKGFPYKEIEARGLYLPVLEVNIQYKRPAKYDDNVTIISRLSEKPFVKIRMDYEVKRDNELLAIAHTIHVFMNKEGQATKAPKFFRDAMEEHFEK